MALADSPYLLAWSNNQDILQELLSYYDYAVSLFPKLLVLPGQALKISEIDSALKIHFLGRITVYETSNIVALFEDLVKDFLSIWESQGFVNIPPNW